ncbi:MAG: AAA family ATPase, partial [Deefgea sp.]
MSSISNRRSAIELDLAPIQHRAKACAAALGVSPSAAQQYADQAEEIYDISIKRAEGGPKVRLYSPTDIFTMSRIRRDTRLWKPLHRAVKIAVYAQKGGVSKTTMAGNIIVMLQLAGHTTLGIDLDHQGNLSTNFGYDPDLTDQEAKDQDICPERVVHHHFGNLFEIVPFYEEAKG